MRESTLTDWFRPLRFVKEETGLTASQIKTIRSKVRKSKNYGFEDYTREIRQILSEIDKSGMTIKQKINFILEDLTKNKLPL